MWGAVLVGLLAPLEHADEVEAYARAGVTAMSMELVPRITRAQTMDVLSSQANLAGYKAAVDAAAEFGRAMPRMMTAAGTIKAARVLVMGAGVAGLQAIATARRLGGVVFATDVRAAAKEQVESLGATFLMVDEQAAKSLSGVRPGVNPNRRVTTPVEQVAMEDIAEEPVVAHNDPSPARERVLRLFEEHHVPLRMVIALPSLDGIKRAVELKLGVALLPRRCAITEIASGRLVAVLVNGVSRKRQVTLVCRKAHRSHAADAFLATAQDKKKEATAASGRGSVSGPRRTRGRVRARPATPDTPVPARHRCRPEEAWRPRRRSSCQAAGRRS